MVARPVEPAPTPTRPSGPAAERRRRSIVTAYPSPSHARLPPPLRSSVPRYLPPPTLARAPLLVGAFVWLFLRACIGFPVTVAALAVGAVIIAAAAAAVALVEARRHGDLLLLGNLGVPARAVALLAALPPLLLDLAFGTSVLRGLAGLLERMG